MVFKEGRRITSPHFALYIKENQLPTARLGVSVAKIHFKLATRRNKIRRKAREHFRKESGRAYKGYDFVLASKAAHPGSNIRLALRELKDLFLRVKNTCLKI